MGPPLAADGGHLALHTLSGGYSITLFTAPSPLVVGPVELSLLIEDASTGETLPDAAAQASLSRAGQTPVQFPLTRQAAGSKLLLLATPTLAAPGSYTLILRVERPGSQPAVVATQLVVAENHRRGAILLFALLLPAAAILLFLINQHAKSTAVRNGRQGSTASVYKPSELSVTCRRRSESRELESKGAPCNYDDARSSHSLPRPR